MSGTGPLRQHHRELLRIASDLSGLLNAEHIKKDANEVRNTLSMLSGKLAVHLAMEDSNFYPSLVNHRDPSVKSIAGRFYKEIGGMKEAFMEYSKRWSTPANIQTHAQEFVIETKNLLGALSKRIEKEDLELYRIADRLEAKKIA